VGFDLDRCELEECSLSGAKLDRLGVLATGLTRCDLSNLNAREATMRRSRLIGCRMTGFTWSEGLVEDTVFRACALDLAAFRFTRLKRVTFEDCVLRDADFQDGRLEGVRFGECDLSKAGFLSARCRDVELRRCRLDDLRAIEGLRGAAVEWDDILALAPALAAALGIRLLDS
jgi:uncharacterized protein YjbI with pentapeptide repeats